MTHPLQAEFDANELRRSELCPNCAFQNAVDWPRCAQCGLCRSGWLVGRAEYHHERTCPECGEAIKVDGVYPYGLDEAQCDSEWCELVQDQPELRRVR